MIAKCIHAHFQIMKKPMVLSAAHPNKETKSEDSGKRGRYETRSSYSVTDGMPLNPLFIEPRAGLTDTEDCILVGRKVRD